MRHALAGLLLPALLTACTSHFDDVNDHLTRPGLDDISPWEIAVVIPEMTALLHSFQENDSQMIEQMVGNQYGGYMVTTNRFNGTNFATLNPQQDWHDDTFAQCFTKFYSNYAIIKAVTKEQGYLWAWVNVIRVGVMLKVVDTYGPIPYSRIDPDQDYTEYDSERDIYHAMIDQLTAAVEVLAPFAAANPNPIVAPYDIMYGGNFTKWVKYANSLKLRMAVRIGLVDTEYAKQVMADAIAAGCIVDNADNAQIATDDNPYYKAAVSWGDLGASATLSTYLTGLNDPRLNVYLTRPLGIRPGIDYLGTEKEIYSNANSYAKPNMTPQSPMLVFCAAETRFLMAEAALRGWITGDARALYEQGIGTSMSHRGVSVGSYMSETMTASEATYADPARPENDFADLITAGGGTPVTVSWDQMTTDEMRLEGIITQKWLANFTLGFEAWADFRRTGYPRMMPVRNNLSSAATGGAVENPTTDLIGANKVRLVRRLPYPLSEYNLNRDNVNAAVANLLGGRDELATELWWAKGNQQ